MLPEVDDDIGHTLIHYLYTGTYQTLRQNPTCGIPSRVIEYKRSVLAYHAALCYGFDGLADLAREYMQTFDKDVPLFDIIALGRKYFPRVTEDTWYSNYITRKIMASFDADEEIFLQEEFFEGFGEAAPEFDKFLGKIMAKAYAQKISLIREASFLNRVDEKPTMPTVLNGKPTVQSTLNACTALERCDEQNSHADSQELASIKDHDALLHWKEYEHTDVESSQVSLLTPSHGTGEWFTRDISELVRLPIWAQMMVFNAVFTGNNTPLMRTYGRIARAARATFSICLLGWFSIVISTVLVKRSHRQLVIYN
jgi:hypothetical protein